MPTIPEQLPAISVRQPSADLNLHGETSVDDSLDSRPTATRFAPVIASVREPPFTAYHSKYFAFELTKRVGADRADKLAQSLSNATVDLNPHQVDDLKENLERELKNIALEIHEAKKVKRLAGELQSKLAAQKRVNELEQQRNQEKRTLLDAQDQIEERKDSLISDVEARFQQRTSRQNVFTIRWRLA